MSESGIAKAFKQLAAKIKGSGDGQAEEETWQEGEPIHADRVDDLKAEGRIAAETAYIWVSGAGIERRLEAGTHTIAWIEEPETGTRRRVVDSVGCVLMAAQPENRQ